MRTNSDQVTEALDVLITHGVNLEEIFERYRATTVEQAAKDYIAKERTAMKDNILKVLSRSGGYVWRDDGSKVIFDDYFVEFYLPLLHLELNFLMNSFGFIMRCLKDNKLNLRQLEYAHLRLVEEPEFRPAQESLLEAA